MNSSLRRLFRYLRCGCGLMRPPLLPRTAAAMAARSRRPAASAALAADGRCDGGRRPAASSSRRPASGGRGRGRGQPLLRLPAAAGGCLRCSVPVAAVCRHLRWRSATAAAYGPRPLPALLRAGSSGRLTAAAAVSGRSRWWSGAAGGGGRRPEAVGGGRRRLAYGSRRRGCGQPLQRPSAPTRRPPAQLPAGGRGMAAAAGSCGQ